MSYLVCWVCGFLGGFLTLYALTNLSAVRGYFYLNPADNEETGFYKINIRLPHLDSSFINKHMIILVKEDSPK